MPTYIYKHPEKEEYIEVIQSMSEDHVYFDKDGVEWKREWTNPQLNCESNIDPFSNTDFIDKTGKMTGTIGDMQDFSREMSEKRASMSGGIDPVKQKYYKEYSKQRKGAKHPQELKERTFENKDFKITYD